MNGSGSNFSKLVTSFTLQLRDFIKAIPGQWLRELWKVRDLQESLRRQFSVCSNVFTKGSQQGLISSWLEINKREHSSHANSNLYRHIRKELLQLPCGTGGLYF